MELKAVRSDLTQDELPHSVLEGLVGGFLGAVVFAKLPEVKERPARTCIWMLTSTEKKTPNLAAIQLAVRTLEKSPVPGAPTVEFLIWQVHQGYARQ